MSFYANSFLRPTLYFVRVTSLRAIKIVSFFHVAQEIIEPRLCNGFSMLPTMAHHGELILASPLYYRTLSGLWAKPPERGDLVIARNPRDPLVIVCKRVIGLEGDVVEVEVRRGGGRKWKEDDNREEEVLEEGQDDIVRSMDTMIQKRKGEGRFIKVPKGHVWLTGDNMSNSTDSRTYGPVPYALIKGKVFMRVSQCFSWLDDPHILCLCLSSWQAWPWPKFYENPLRHLDGPPI